MRPHAAYRTKRKFARSGRHRAPPTAAQRTVRLLGVAVPAVALAGALAVAQFHPYSALSASGDSATSPTHADSLARRGAASTSQLGGAVAAAAARALSGEVALGRSGRSNAAARVRTPPTARRSPTATPGKAHTAPGPKTTAAPAPSTSAPVASAPATSSCTGTGSADAAFLPANYVTIVNFLIAHGYTRMAAVGIAGNIYQESKGNPESVGTGGGGLIGWTPLPPGYVTGNPAADLQTQLTALLTYNQQWAQYIPMLNAASSPAQAAAIFMDYFERPGVPVAYDRESAAQAVAQACGFG